MENINSSVTQLKELKDLLSKLTAVADNINALNDATNGNVSYELNYSAAGNIIPPTDPIIQNGWYDGNSRSIDMNGSYAADDWLGASSFTNTDRCLPNTICNNPNESKARFFNDGGGNNVVTNAVKCLPERPNDSIIQNGWYDGNSRSIDMNGSYAADDWLGASSFTNTDRCLPNTICNNPNESKARFFNDVGGNNVVTNAVKCLPERPNDSIIKSGSYDANTRSIDINGSYADDGWLGASSSTNTDRCMPNTICNNPNESNVRFFNDDGGNKVFNVELSIDNYFSDRRLQSVLADKTSEWSPTNYLYYLYDDIDVVPNVVECLPNGPHNLIHDLNSAYSANCNTTGHKVLSDSHDDFHNDSDDLAQDLSSGQLQPIFSYSTDKDADLLDTEPESSCKIKIIPHQGCDNSNMYIPTTDDKAKTLCCMYCDKRYQKLARHLQTVHKNEIDVKKFRSFPPGSKARQNIIQSIRKRGQFKWNTTAKINGNVFLTSRRLSAKFKKTVFDYLCCANCFGTYAKTVVARHWNKCTKYLMIDGRIVSALGRTVEGRLHVDASDELRTDVFPKIRDDVRVRAIRYDWLVIAYGNDMCLNYSPHYQHGYICKKLRDAAKVLFAAKSISTAIEDFASLFHVKHCNTVVESIRVVSKFNRQTKLFGSPGTASTLVTLINTIGDLLIIESMKLDDQEREKNVERFLKVFQKDVKTKVNKLVAITQAKNRRFKKVNIPTSEDVNKLSVYLDSQRDKCFNELTEKFTYQKWIQLSELTLVSILVFNRRRTGEMRNILINDYDNREDIASQCDEALDVLSDETKRLMKSRMKIRGKLGRTVPVLLKHSVEHCIDLLVHHRNDVGISHTNEFLFALPSKVGRVKTVDACASIRSFSVACGAKNPSSLRGTLLRKHMASFCGTRNLTDNDVTNLANFMGHDDKIHRDIYRHNPLNREVEQMTHLLEAAQGRISTTSTIDANATHAKAVQDLISSDTSSDSSSGDDGPDDVEPEKIKPFTGTSKRKAIRRPAQCKAGKLASSNGKKSGVSAKTGQALKMTKRKNIVNRSAPKMSKCKNEKELVSAKKKAGK